MTDIITHHWLGILVNIIFTVSYYVWWDLHKVKNIGWVGIALGSFLSVVFYIGLILVWRLL